MLLAGVLCGLPQPGLAAGHFSVWLDAPPKYQQAYISSCEAAATHIALQMMGVRVPEKTLIAELPADRRPPVYGSLGAVVRWGDPYRGFVGDITRGDSWPMVGYGVYAPPIVRLLRLHGMTGSYGGPHMSLDDLRSALDDGHPVIVWVPKLSLYWYKPTLERGYWTTWDGKRVIWSFEEHAQVLVGYDDSGFWLDNPDYERWSGGQWLWHYSISDFQRGWDVLADQAVVVTRGTGPLAHTLPAVRPVPPGPRA